MAPYRKQYLANTQKLKREDIEKQVAEAESVLERVGKFISSRRWRG